MNHLLAIEWLKIKRYRTFWVLIGLFAFLFPLLNFGINGGLFKFGPGIDILGSSYSFGAVWSNVCFYASHFVIFLSILMAILVTNEFSFRTNRQNVIDGQSRMQFYHAKWGIAVVMALATTVFVFLTGVGMGISKGADWGGFTTNISKVLWLAILSLNYYGFALLLSLLVKKSGLVIGLLLLYYMMIETMIHSFFYYKERLFAADLFLPLESSDQMLRFPTLESLEQTAKVTSSIPVWGYAIASLCWITLYYIIGRARLLRSDW